VRTTRFTCADTSFPRGTTRFTCADTRFPHADMGFACADWPFAPAHSKAPLSAAVWLTHVESAPLPVSVVVCNVRGFTGRFSAFTRRCDRAQAHCPPPPVQSIVHIRNALLTELTRRFGDESFLPGETPEDVAVFPAAHPAVGSVIVSDDGDEASVTIGTITHGHFNDFDLPIEAAAPVIATAVAEFLERLFAGRVLLWKSRSGSSGGWRDLDEDETPKPRRGAQTFLWQGPVE
jgi:hypothetical protein